MSLQDTLDEAAYVQQETERAYWALRYAVTGRQHVEDWELWYDEAEYFTCKKVKFECELCGRDKAEIVALLRSMADAIESA